MLKFALHCTTWIALCDIFSSYSIWQFCPDQECQNRLMGLLGFLPIALQQAPVFKKKSIIWAEPEPGPKLRGDDHQSVQCLMWAMWETWCWGLPSLSTPVQTSAGPPCPHNSCNYTGPGPPGGNRPMRAVRLRQGCRRSSLLVSWAQNVELLIRPALAIYHSLPSLQGEGLILTQELKHPGPAGKEETPLYEAGDQSL